MVISIMLHHLSLCPRFHTKGKSYEITGQLGLNVR